MRKDSCLSGIKKMVFVTSHLTKTRVISHLLGSLAFLHTFLKLSIISNTKQRFLSELKIKILFKLSDSHPFSSKMSWISSKNWPTSTWEIAKDFLDKLQAETGHEIMKRISVARPFLQSTKIHLAPP